MWNKTRTATAIWITAFILSTFRGTVVRDILAGAFRVRGLPWLEVALWVILLAISIRLMVITTLVDDYIQAWRQNPSLILFMGMAILSLLWSIAFSTTLYRTAALLFASLIGAYLGTSYSLRGLLDTLFHFGAILLLVCLDFALFLPAFGRMGWSPYNGAWRGVFWHKNQFGSVVALFSLVFLMLGLDELSKEDGTPIRYFIFYAFSAVLVYLSQSVAGYLLCMGMSGLVVLVYLWLKIRHRLTSTHYYAFVISASLVTAVIVFNLDSIFGLFNRDTSLTGRLPMWSYLVTDVIAKSPWLGYGFGAVWSSSSFRISVQHAVGWGFAVAIGDNGFLDILLHVGLLGFIPFVGVLITLFVRAVKYSRQQASLLNFFPLLLAIFAVMANITFSLFLETESFLWLIMVAVLFIVSRPPHARTGSQILSAAPSDVLAAG